MFFVYNEFKFNIYNSLNSLVQGLIVRNNVGLLQVKI